MSEVDIEQKKKDMAECPPWILNTLKITSEKAKNFEKQYKEIKLKLDKLIEGTQQWKIKVEKECNDKIEKKEQEVKDLKELLKKAVEQSKEQQKLKEKLMTQIQPNQRTSDLRTSSSPNIIKSDSQTSSSNDDDSFFNQILNEVSLKDNNNNNNSPSSLKPKTSISPLDNFKNEKNVKNVQNPFNLSSPNLSTHSTPNNTPNTTPTQEHKKQFKSPNLTSLSNSLDHIITTSNSSGTTSPPSPNLLLHQNKLSKDQFISSKIILQKNDESIEINEIKSSMDDGSKSIILSSLIANEEFAKILLSQLTETIKLKQLEKMLPSLVELFNHKGITVDLIQHFVKEEIQNSKSLGTLFRGNSLASKLIKDYLPSSPLIPYLRSLFFDLIKSVVSDNKELEIDPEKDENKKHNIQENIQEILKLTSSFLESVLVSASSLPLSFRNICSTLASSVQEKYGEQQKALGVGALLFLRIFCPLISAPWSFGFFNSPAEIPENSRRTLVLISKIITNIANQQTGSGGLKEGYMVSTDKFVEENIEKVVSFLLSISSLDNHPPTEEKKEKKEIDEVKCLGIYKKIATEIINGGRDKLVSSLEKLYNPLTPNSPYLFSLIMDFQLFQLYVPLLKLLGIPEKGKKYEKENKTVLNFISLLFQNEMVLSSEIISSSLLTKKIDISSLSLSFLSLSLSLTSSSSSSLYASPSSISGNNETVSGNYFSKSLFYNGFSVYSFFETILKNELSFFSQNNLPNFCEESFTSHFFVQVCLKYASSFLKETLSSLIFQITDNNPFLEYDQKKLPPELSASENIQQLISTTKNIVEKVLTSMISFPFFIWKFLNILLQQFSLFHPPKDSSFVVPDVCQFLFSALFCSAIQNPKLFRLIDITPRKEASRTLQIIAEILKKIATGKRVFAESNVEDLNFFIKENSNPVSQYVNAWSSQVPSSQDKWVTEVKIESSEIDDALFNIHQSSLVLQHNISKSSVSTIRKEIVFTPSEAIFSTVTHSFAESKPIKENKFVKEVKDEKPNKKNK